MKEIELTQGLKAQVDDEDFEELNRFNWCAHKGGNTYYAERKSPRINGDRHIIKMHHVINGFPPKGKMTDHADGNGLHNEKYNLRNVTRRQNSQNIKHAPKTSQYPGVDWLKKYSKWRSRIQINGITKHLGVFVSEIKAFNAYKAAVESTGEKVIGY